MTDAWVRSVVLVVPFRHGPLLLLYSAGPQSNACALRLAPPPRGPTSLMGPVVGPRPRSSTHRLLPPVSDIPERTAPLAFTIVPQVRSPSPRE